MFNMLLNIVNSGVVGNTSSPDNIPDGTASGINHERLNEFLLIIILILFIALIYMIIKYCIVKDRYKELKRSDKNLNNKTNIKESDK